MNPDHVSSHYTPPCERKAGKAISRKAWVARLIKQGHTRKRAIQIARGKL